MIVLLLVIFMQLLTKLILANSVKIVAGAINMFTLVKWLCRYIQMVDSGQVYAVNDQDILKVGEGY